MEKKHKYCIHILSVETCRKKWDICMEQREQYS